VADKQEPNTISGNISQKILELTDDNITVLKATVPMESVVGIKGPLSVSMTFVQNIFCSEKYLKSYASGMRKNIHRSL